MRPTITCSACGTVLGVPKGGMPKDGLSCIWCGYVNLSTADLPPSAKPTPHPAPEPVPAAAAAETPAPVRKAMPHRWADDEDDDGQPYDLPPDAVKKRKCEGCGKD